MVPFAAQLCSDVAADRVRASWRRTLAEGEATAVAATAAEQREARYKTRAIRLREILTELGPTFIKFGQMLSIRPDVIPPAAVYELQRLCDSVYASSQGWGCG